MEIYKPPKADLDNNVHPVGICPNCNNQVSIWAVSKPSLSLNKFYCNHCSKSLRYIMPGKYIILLNGGVFSIFLSTCGILLFLYREWIFIGSLTLYLILLIMFLGIGMIIQIVAGYLDAQYCSRHFKIELVEED